MRKRNSETTFLVVPSTDFVRRLYSFLIFSISSFTAAITVSWQLLQLAPARNQFRNSAHLYVIEQLRRDKIDGAQVGKLLTALDPDFAAKVLPAINKTLKVSGKG